jgi:hypothetical protein
MFKKLALALIGPALLLLASAPIHPAQATTRFGVFISQPGYTYPYYPYRYAYPYDNYYPYAYGSPYGPYYNFGWGWGWGSGHGHHKHHHGHRH